MKYVVATVFDSAAMAYLRPMFFRSEGECHRMWSDAVNDPKGMYFAHPEDYTFLQVGEWDELTGELSSCDAARPRLIIKALSVIERNVKHETAGSD